MSRPRSDTATSSPSRAPLRLKYVEAILCIGFALAFIIWTYLSAPGPLTPSATQHSPAIDALLPTPDTQPRSAAGQLADGTLREVAHAHERQCLLDGAEMRGPSTPK